MSAPAHAPMDQFPVGDNQLQVGGRAVAEWAEEHGTPLYLYDRAVIDRRIDALRRALPKAIRLHYAIKANPYPPLLKFMAARVDGFDVASAGELSAALQAGMAPRFISFAGPGKRDEELAAAIEAGICINLESEIETGRVAAIGQTLGIRPRVAVRVNPAFELKASGMQMGGGPKPFGVDEEKVPALFGLIRELELDLVGLHIFAGSQNLKAEAIIETYRQTFALARRLSEGLAVAGFRPLQHLNIGGGLGIPYFPGEQRLDLTAIGDALADLMREHATWLGKTQVVMELGRYLVGEAGLYVTRVVDRKHSRGETYIVCDGGMHQHLALSGNLGQVIRKNYPVVVANRVQSEFTEVVNIVGPLCTPLDILASRMALPTLQPGDLVAVYQSGAYGLTASPVHFLGHPKPAEVLV